VDDFDRRVRVCCNLPQKVFLRITRSRILANHLIINLIVNMHHPQIYDTISILEDFFLLTDTQFRCQIEPALYFKSISKELTRGEEDTPAQDYKGFRIIRPLNNGRVEINIFGYSRDNDSMDVQYFCHNDQEPMKIIELLSLYNDGYNTEAVKAAIREVIILDRNSVKAMDVSD
jgi:hypothetical protein